MRYYSILKSLAVLNLGRILGMIFSGVICICILPAKAQERCGAVEYRKQLLKAGSSREDTRQFEQWIQQKLEDKQKRSGSGRIKATLQIPVVVHVIHNGEALGTGRNIPDAQVISQINVLNKDYRRLNTDATNTPTEFLPVASSFDVQFVLARQSPEGIATSGIVRVQGPKSNWTMNDNYQLKSLSYWPAEDYLNIWVCNLTDYLGYSQFPVSGLPGLENSSTNRLTDGVVIASNAFGSNDDGAFTLYATYNKGRTATHEIGHFFGLNHIWGDDDNACTGTDYVDDTPNQAGSSSGCPTHPRVTCDVTSMFQNYLDYTNDACMNLFTAGQVSRMTTVMQNSPRRASLPTSHGLNPPAPANNDLGIRSIVSPGSGLCPGTFSPIIEVRNYGSNNITDARIQFMKDGVLTETRDVFFGPALTALESRNVTFNTTSFTSGTHSTSFQITQTNGAPDGASGNNSLSQSVEVPQTIALPFLQDFTTLPASWKINNPDLSITWQLTQTNNATNQALGINLFSYEDHVGEIDALVTPVFNLSTAPAALLKFDVAYSRFQNSEDGLKVILLSNCNTNLEQGVEVYSKSGSTLSTTSASTSNFVPANSSQWRTEVIDLSAYAGQGNFQLAFVSYNDWGNNIYLDNIGLTATAIHDVVVRKIVAPSPVTCNNQSPMTVRAYNAGTMISTLKAVITVNGTTTTQNLVGLNFPGNTERDINLAPVALAADRNEITVQLTDPDGDIDFFPDNNTASTVSVIDASTDIIPLRQDFEGNYDNWVAANPTGGMNWTNTPVGRNTTLSLNYFDNNTIGDMAWLVSPTLDFSSAEEISLRFDLSYAAREGQSERLLILASLDCGLNFSDTIYSRAGYALADGKGSATSWVPSTETDWRSLTLNLTRFAGNPSVRLAFVAVNDHGNNLYIDNLEFFLSLNPLETTETVIIYPNPVIDENSKITFNLPERANVRIDVVDVLGELKATQYIDNVLNQTYPFDIPQSSTGVYFVRVTAGRKTYVEKILVNR